MRWKRWIVFASAAFLARVVQMIQSLVAFGWDGAMADWFGRWNTMANQDGRASILEHFLSISRELRYLIGFGWDKHRIIELHLLVIFSSLLRGSVVASRKKREGTLRFLVENKGSYSCDSTNSRIGFWFYFSRSIVDAL